MTSGIADVLRRIVERRRERLAEEFPEPVFLAERPERLAVEESPFLAALAARRGRAVIAEIKMGSPRLGPLAGRVDPLAQAALYGRGGAAALSVVVEPDFFHGSYELLARCKEVSGLPALAKDFVFRPLQLRLAREAGADAVLLIAALHPPAKLARFAAMARAQGLVPLVETHSAEDVARLRGSDWELVGVNNRDLATFEVDLERSIERLPGLPAAALKVAESGIAARADLERLARAGFDAFLVGEALLVAEDPAARLAELTGGGA